jgi:rfaE bifunctional protein kinase chain/domain
MKTIFVSGTFNVLHPGHLRLFKYAKELGSKLIVGVLSDRIAGSDAFIQENYRLEGILNQVLVTEACIVDVSVEDFIRRVRPDIVLKGKEFELSVNPELRALNEYGGKLIFSSGESSFSSLDLLNKNKGIVSRNSIALPENYKLSHNFETKELVRNIQLFQNLNICVIGDVIVDEYIACEPIGMSQEDPTIVVSPISSEKFLGGAGIVAAHAVGLGASASYLGVVGIDGLKNYLEIKLRESNVNSTLYVDETRPTTLKTRYRANGKTLLRVNQCHKSCINKEIQEKILNSFKANVHTYDALIFSDFNHGCLPTELVRELTKIARLNSLIVAADSQSSSQIGDLSRFIGLDLITPTEREARLALRDQESGLVVLAEKLKLQTQAKNVLLKLGGDGALLLSDYPGFSTHAIKIPAINSLPVDVAGAGDSMLTATILALAGGANIHDAAFLGSIAAAVQVGRLGNIPLDKDEVVNIIRGFD